MIRQGWSQPGEAAPAALTASERSDAHEYADPGTLVGLGFEWITLAVAALIVAAVAIDMLGLPLAMLSVVVAAVLALLPLVYLAARGARQPGAPLRRGDLWTEALLLGVIGVVGWHVLAPAWPSLLPIGNSPDAVHHTALANYVLEQRHLVRDPGPVRELLIEMADYPPGFAALTVVAAQALGLSPIRVIYPLAALAVIAAVLGCALLIVTSVPRQVRPAAGAAALAALLMPDYILGAVASQSYYPQMLAQWLLVAVGYVLARHRGARRLLPLALLLLALLLVYTTWLPVALLAVTLALLIQRIGWSRRLIEIGALVVPVALLALVYSWSRASTGSAVVLHEGETIRDPLAATGLALPALALLGLVRAWREPRRWAVLWLIAAAALQIVGLGLLWRSGRIAGYIYYKGYYLLALLLVVPLGWLLADALGYLLRRQRRRYRVWRAIQSTAVLAAMGGALFLPGLPVAAEPAEHPLSPSLVEAARWVREHGTPDDVRFALRKPGASAYWLHVGVLGQPRTAAAHRLLTDPPTTYLEWYFHPLTTRTLLLEQPTLPQPHDGLAVRFQNECCVVVEKTEAYPAALQALRPLQVSYSAAFVDGRQQIDVELFDALDQPDLRLRVVVQGADAQPLAAYTLDVPRRTGRVQYLGVAFNLQTLAATGYANDAPGVEWPATTAAAPAQYRVLLQLLKQEALVREQELGTCCVAPDVWVPTIIHRRGSWSYFQAPQPAAAATRDHTLGEAIGLIDAQIERESFRPGETLDVRLRWRARQTIAQPFTTFVQLIATDGGAAVSTEGTPNGGATPTWRWQAGDLIDDRWQLKLPADLRPGSYQVVVGMYDPTTGQRLEAWQRSPSVERFWTNALPLGVVEVRP
ncbi:MAG TPA: hypothetical protein VFZ66_18205 [Herpetosiphonaceae bacterium]